jgi:glycerophosphoryl diester phosphodiesterase
VRSRQRRRTRGARIVVVLARLVSLPCLAALLAAALLGAEVERVTAGQTPPQRTGDGVGDRPVLDDRIVGVAHNAGDSVEASYRAVAHGADAVEVDVRTLGGTLIASHDRQVPGIGRLVFRGPALAEVWDVLALRETVLLHLKERSEQMLERLAAFAASHAPRRLIVQSDDPGTLRAAQRALPDARRLLLVLDGQDLARVGNDPQMLGSVHGVSVREDLLSRSVHRRFEQRGLLTYAWTVNEEHRLRELAAGGLDGVITDRLDLLRLVGHRSAAPG